MAQEIDRQRTAKRDFLAQTGEQIRLVTGPAPQLAPVDHETIRRGRPVATMPRPKPIFLNVQEQGQFDVGPVAHGQISQWTSIPKKYYDRMLTEAPDLLTANVNEWFTQAPARRMVRTLDSRARAFLSDKYRIIDHEDILSAILPVFGDVGLSSRDIISCEVTERRLYVKALFPRVQGEVKKGEVVQAGVVVSNSELGLGRVNIESLVYKLACLNGMIQGSLISKYHVGRSYTGTGGDGPEEYYKDDTLQAIDSAFMRQMRDTVTHAASETGFAKTLEKFREATGMKVENPLGAVEEIKKRFALTEDDKAGVLTHLIEGGDLSKWGIANALTRYSQDVDDYDRATDLEKLGGTVIDLNPGDWKTISTAKAA